MTGTTRPISTSTGLGAENRSDSPAHLHHVGPLLGQAHPVAHRALGARVGALVAERVGVGVDDPHQPPAGAVEDAARVVPEEGHPTARASRRSDPPVQRARTPAELRPRGPHAGGDALGREGGVGRRLDPRRRRRRGTTAACSGPSRRSSRPGSPRRRPARAWRRCPAPPAARCGSCRRSASSGGRSSRRSSTSASVRPDGVGQGGRGVGQGDRRGQGARGRRRWRCGTRG